jgi:hypothetical protein
LIVDIPIAQEWLTTLKKEDQRTPKSTHRVPYPVRSIALSKSIYKEATNHGKNGKNNLQLNTPDPLPLKSSQASRLHYSVCLVVSPASQHTQKLGAPRSPHYTTCYLGNTREAINSV